MPHSPTKRRRFRSLWIEQWTRVNRIRTADDSANTSVEVKAVSLDEILAGEYAFGKLDIEGAEPLALSGASMMPAKHNPPVWQLELVDRFVQRFGWSALDVASPLAGTRA